MTCFRTFAKLLDRRKRYFRDEIKLLAGVIAAGQKAREFVKGDPEEIAKTFLLATNSLLPFGLSSFGIGNRSEIEQATIRIADTMLNGIIHRSDK